MLSNPETQPAPNRLARWAVWVIPVLFLLCVYHDGLRTWFSQDDFAWLSLLNLVRIRHDLLHELFAPAAQGTIRPWSERGFFILMEWLFDLNSIPYRIVVFATAAGSVLLLTWITIRITGSRIAGFVAPVLWSANYSLFTPLTWTSSYNEIMCSAFLLGALALFIRYAETGNRKFWWWQLAVFVLGFGALETNIIYPALAAAYILFATNNGASSVSGHGFSPAERTAAHTLFATSDEAGSVSGHGFSRAERTSNSSGFSRCDRPALSTKSLLLSQIPLALISTLYFFIHRAAAPLQKTGNYVLHFNKSILRSIAIYCDWSLVPESAERAGRSHHAMQLALVIEAIAIAAFVVTELRRGNRRIWFYLAWFAIVLAPMLPLTEHRVNYYIMIPVMGLSMLGGEAVARYWRGSTPARAFVAVTLLAYFCAMIPSDLAATHWWFQETQKIRAMYLGSIEAQQVHRGKAVVLDGITSDLFILALAQVQFNAGQLEDVYLTPESAREIDPTVPDLAGVNSGFGNEKLRSLTLPPEVLWHGITHNDVVVYSPESDHLRNVTEGYTRQLAGRTVGRFPSRVDVGNFLYSWLLGPTWLPVQSGVRWMPADATLQIGVPPGGKVLELEGECPRTQLLVSPRHLMVLVDGNVVGDTRIYDPESTFHRLFPIPVALLAGKDSVEIEIRVDPVHRIDGQDYGVLFGKIALSP